ncbi:hypothetical protein GCM10009815_19790 [Nocardioides marmoribigeumensis]
MAPNVRNVRLWGSRGPGASGPAGRDSGPRLVPIPTNPHVGAPTTRVSQVAVRAKEPAAKVRHT